MPRLVNPDPARHGWTPTGVQPEPGTSGMDWWSHTADDVTIDVQHTADGRLLVYVNASIADGWDSFVELGRFDQASTSPPRRVLNVSSDNSWEFAGRTTGWTSARHWPTGTIVMWLGGAYVFAPGSLNPIHFRVGVDPTRILFPTDVQGTGIPDHWRSTPAGTGAGSDMRGVGDWVRTNTERVRTNTERVEPREVSVEEALTPIMYWHRADDNEEYWPNPASGEIAREYVCGGRTSDEPLTTVYVWSNGEFRIVTQTEEFSGSWNSFDGFWGLNDHGAWVRPRSGEWIARDGTRVRHEVDNGQISIIRTDRARRVALSLGRSPGDRLAAVYPERLAERVAVGPVVDWEQEYSRVDNPTTVGYDLSMPATATVEPTITAPASTLHRDDVDWDGYFPTVMAMEPAARHLDPSLQAWIYRLVTYGYTQASIANVFGLTTGSDSRHASHHATAHALQAYCNRTGTPMPSRRRRRAAGPTNAQAPRTGNLILGRAFGIEVEYNGQGAAPYRLAEELRRLGIEAQEEGYNHTTPTYWKCTTDGTVSGGECVSPILTAPDAVDEIRPIMQAITRLGSTVGTQCGTHIHHNVNDLDGAAMRRLVVNIGFAHYAMLNYVLDRRLGASYVADIGQDVYNRLLGAIDNGRLVPTGQRSSANREGSYLGVDRYVVFNFNSVLTYGTVEFRAHQGTLNATKIEAWIGLGQAMVEFSRRGGEFDGTVTTNEMVDRFLAEGLLAPVLARRVRERVSALHGAERLDIRRTLRQAA